jgi:hypothetical protein
MVIKKSEIIGNFITMNKEKRNNYLEKIMRRINSETNEEKRNKLNSLLIVLREKDSEKSKKEEKEEIINKIDNSIINPPDDNLYDFSKPIDKKKDNGYHGITHIIQNMINTLPDYVNGKNEDYYKNEYIRKNTGFDEGEGKEFKGGKTQKRKKIVKSKRMQRTIKNKVRY